MSEFKETLAAVLPGLGLSLTEEQLSQCEVYYKLLYEANKKMNLTTVDGEKEAALKHFADSLALLSLMDIPEGSSLLDIGTGAGFPGLALKIARPDLQITLLDSLEKRCKFLHTVIETLGLTQTEVLWGRAEDLARDPRYRGTFSCATARAVASLPVLLEYALPFLCIGGKFYALKGKEEPLPTEALSLLAGEKTREEVYTLDAVGSRRIYEFTKLGATPEKYPRKAGKVTKRPLGTK